jgi:hypothetical protein
MQVLTVPNQKATANYVPAAAVIRRWQALSGIIGRKARVGGFFKSDVKAHGSTVERSLETGELECRRGEWNSMCSGEMRRDMEEHQWRRRLSGL